MKKRAIPFYFGVIPGLFFQLIGAFLYFVLFADRLFSQQLYTGTKILILIWPLAWWLMAREIWRRTGSTERVKSLFLGIV